jgi:hypothetical protein
MDGMVLKRRAIHGVEVSQGNSRGGGRLITNVIPVTCTVGSVVVGVPNA